MAMKNPADSLRRFQERAAASGGEYRAGIGRVQDSPMEAAAAQQDAYLRGVQEAATSGRWARGLRSVTLEDWKRQAQEKGSQNYATGVGQLSQRARSAMERNFGIVNRVAEQVRAMPRSTLEQRIQRAVEQMRLMAATRGEARQ